MRRIFFNKHWWKNRIKYQPLVQRLFLLLSLSHQFPATLNVEPTNICNLDCSFCPVKKTNRRRGFIELGFYRRVIDEIAREKRLNVLWLNKDGEPLLHPEIDRMISYANKKKVADRVEIYTNGVCLTESMARRLIEADLDSLVVSLDAIDKESFKKLKRKDVYDRVVVNIKKFLNFRRKLKVQKPLLSVKMVDLGKKNEIEKFRKLWEGIADDMIIQKLHGWEGSTNYQVFSPPPRSPFGHLGGVSRYPCNLPWLAPAINWDGKVVPCCVNFRENELIMGDLKKQSLTEIWRGDKFKKLREAHLKQDFSDWPTCARCTFWKQLPDMEWWLGRLSCKTLK